MLIVVSDYDPCQLIIGSSQTILSFVSCSEFVLQSTDQLLHLSDVLFGVGLFSECLKVAKVLHDSILYIVIGW
jgi:hypothetical protein